MRFFSILFFGLLLFSMQGQTLNHPTIDSVNVTYYPYLQDTLNLQTGVEAIPQATISLKSTASPSKIYFKILDSSSGATLYSVSYALSSAAVSDGSGNLLFQNNSGTVVISSGQPLPIRPYSYEIVTEDSSQNQTIAFSTLQ